jgi:hypothetical protein
MAAIMEPKATAFGRFAADLLPFGTISGITAREVD